jgi:hypothetical protein
LFGTGLPFLQLIPKKPTRMWWIPLLPPGLGVGVAEGVGVGDGVGEGDGVGDGEGVGLGVGLGLGLGVGLGVALGPGDGVALGSPAGGGPDGEGVGLWSGLVMIDGKTIGWPSTGWMGLGWTGLDAVAACSSGALEHDRTQAKDGMKARRRSLIVASSLEMT